MSNLSSNKISVFWGLTASLVLLVVYFVVVSLISGQSFALEQFSKFWPFLLGLSFGFGLQVFLYNYINNLTRQMHEKMQVKKEMVVTSGSVSTVAMLSCCSHYLVNLFPLLGVTGFLTIISQYQVELFWFGLLLNTLATGYFLFKAFQIRSLMKKHEH